MKLCPKCDSDELCFDITVEMQVTVSWDADSECLEVVNDVQTSGFEWEDSDRAYCPECGWAGTVGDVSLPDDTEETP